uniref:Uncharacterized protein n=1 Tax=Anguilla anguilla TaxID=7936 RepID=A0A0E9XL27_ANGAN
MSMLCVIATYIHLTVPIHVSTSCKFSYIFSVSVLKRKRKKNHFGSPSCFRLKVQHCYKVILFSPTSGLYKECEYFT